MRTVDLRGRIQLHCMTLVAHCKRLEVSGEFLTNTAVDLCRIIGTTAEAIRTSTPDCPDDKLREVARFVTLVSAHVRYAERSKIENTPWSMIPSLESFFRESTGPDCSLIIRPQWSYNYGMLGDFVEYYTKMMRSSNWADWLRLEDWEQALGDILSKRIYCVSFPRLERTNCLLHSLLGHEVGHLVIKRKYSELFMRVWKREEEELKKDLRGIVQDFDQLNEVKPIFRSTAIEELVSDIHSEAYECAKKGLEEVLCDLYANRLLGPAVLIAINGMANATSMDENPLGHSYYPPWRFRMRVVMDDMGDEIETLKEMSKSAEYSLLIPYVQLLDECGAIVRDTSDLETVKSEIVSRKAYEFIDIHLDEFKAILSPIVGDSRYYLTKRLPHVVQLVELINEGIPPNEEEVYPNNKPSTLPDILNAGWICKSSLDDDATIENLPHRYEWMFKLILKGIESSYIHQCYLKACSE